MTVQRSFDNRRFDAVIVGAGLAGLAAAFYARRKGWSVCLLESSLRAGGVVRSEQRNGFVLEMGPNTVMPTADLLELCEELGLEKEMLLADPNIPRFVQIGGQLHPVPLSPPALVKTSLLSVAGRIRLLREPFVRRGKKGTDESLASFIERRLGREACDRLVAPFVSGVWAGDIEKLSASASFPSLARWEKEKGSIFRGLFSQKKDRRSSVPRGLMSFNGGLETLVNALAAALVDDLYVSQSVTEIQPGANGEPWTLTTTTGSISARRIFLTAPAYAVQSLVRPISREAADALARIDYAPIVTLHLSCSRSDLGEPLHGFGFLVAPSEKSEVLGCLWNSNLFPNRSPRDSFLFTTYLGGATRPDVIVMKDQEILKAAVTSLVPILKLRRHPDLIALTRIEKAIPQYNLGHEEKLSVLGGVERERKGLFFGGNYSGGISVGDVVKSAKALVEKAV